MNENLASLALQVSTFNRKMNKDKKQFAVVMLITLHICASLSMEFSHQHVFYGRSDGHQTIQNHSCGVIEIHRSLENCRHCLLCLRDSTSNATLESSFTVSGACIQPIVESEIIRTLAVGMHFSEPDRGPPSFSA
jgi:hypothetical protein